MQPLVQSAFEAANRGENSKAVELLKQALSANPSDVDAWLVLAAVIEQPERKRQCLNRVLSLDPTNQIARDELLEMDRAAMGSTPAPASEPASFPKPAPSSLSYSTSTSAFEPAPVSQPSYLYSPVSDYPASTSASQPAAPVTAQPQAKALPGPSSRSRREEPRVYHYATMTQIMIYIGAGIFAILSLLSITHPILLCLPCGMFLLSILAIWIVSVQIETSERGIYSSHLYGLIGSQVSWNEIARIRSASMQKSLELTTKAGKRVKISSQVDGYSAIIEMLRKKRPDLFDLAASPSGHASAAKRSSAAEPAATASTAKFEKSFFKQFGSYLLTIPFGAYSVWMFATRPDYRISAAIAICCCAVFIVIPIFQVNVIKLEPNKLTIETLFEKKVFSARQISEIKIQSARGRYGRISHYVNIIPLEGKNYPLQGFPAGDEVIYGFLVNWWNTYAGQ